MLEYAVSCLHSNNPLSVTAIVITPTRRRQLARHSRLAIL